MTNISLTDDLSGPNQASLSWWEHRKLVVQVNYTLSEGTLLHHTARSPHNGNDFLPMLFPFRDSFRINRCNYWKRRCRHPGSYLSESLLISRQLPISGWCPENIHRVRKVGISWFPIMSVVRTAWSIYCTTVVFRHFLSTDSSTGNQRHLNLDFRRMKTDSKSETLKQVVDNFSWFCFVVLHCWIVLVTWCFFSSHLIQTR